MIKRPTTIPLDMAFFTCIPRADYDREQLKAIQAKAVAPIDIDAELRPNKPKRRKVKMPLDIS